MRILLITQWFDPEPTFKGLLFARELARHGHEVEVLTGFPNYPGGKVYPGYRIRPWRRERIEGIAVTRVALYPSHNRSGGARAFNYLSFAVTAAIAALVMRRPDVVYLYHPPGTAALPALASRLIRGIPFVVDVQDLWPDTLAATGMLTNRRLLAIVGGWMRHVYHRAAHVVVLSHGFRRRLLDQGLPPEKVTVIPNWTYDGDVDAADPALAERLGFTGRFNVVFAGTMGKAQALETVLGAAARLRDTHPEIRFCLIGGGVERERLQARSVAMGLTNVAFLERRPPSEIPAILALADALLVHLRDDPLFEITVPSKTQAYLRAGRPILIGVRGDAARIVTDAGAGRVFSPEDPESLAAATIDLMQAGAEARRRMGDAGRACYDRDFSLDAGGERWAALLDAARYSNRRGFGLKRVFDVAASATLLVALSPLLVLVAWQVARKLGRPIVFSQDRPGRYGTPFRLRKFRTMTDAMAPDGTPLPDRDRLTPFGAWLRRTSLDELPSLLNVLRGEISFVGPRPLLMRYTAFFSAEERLRLLVRPGLTGWAQVNGRNRASWDDRLGMDVWYVKNWSLRLDLRILMRTVRHVFQRRDIVPDAESIMQNLDDERRQKESS